MYERITTDPGVLGGKPCIRGTRISVQHILELVASGASRDDILQAYRHLAEDHVAQALGYAAHVLNNDIVIISEMPGEAA